MTLRLALILYVICLHSVLYQAMKDGLEKCVISCGRYLWLRSVRTFTVYVFFDERGRFLDAPFPFVPFGRQGSGIVSF